MLEKQLGLFVDHSLFKSVLLPPDQLEEMPIRQGMHHLPFGICDRCPGKQC